MKTTEEILGEPLMELIEKLKEDCSDINSLEDIPRNFDQLLTETLKAYLLYSGAKLLQLRKH